MKNSWIENIARQYYEYKKWYGNRGIVAGGHDSTNTKFNSIEYVTISINSNASDFGDLYLKVSTLGSAINSTRALIFGSNPSAAQSITYITTSIKSDTMNFGDMHTRKDFTSGASNNTRALIIGGKKVNSSIIFSDITYVYFDTLSMDYTFGTLSVARHGTGSCCNGYKVLTAGGVGPGVFLNIIDYVLISEIFANSVDFGDLTVASGYVSACSGD